MSIPSQEIEKHLQKRQFFEADRLIHEALLDDPEDIPALYMKSVSFFLQGKLGPAIEGLKKTLDHSPDHTDAAICLSIIYNDIGKYDEAKSVFEKASQTVSFSKLEGNPEIDRKFSQKHLEIADLYFRYRRYDEAIEEYNKAAVLDHRDFDCRLRRAKAFAKKGLLSRAFQELEQIKTESPNFLPARVQLGALHFSQGDVLNAELEWEAVLAIEPEHGEAKHYLEIARTNR